MAMVLDFPRTDRAPVDYFPDAERLTPPRARALGRMAAQPQSQGDIPLHLLPACTTLNALAMKGMDAELMAMRTGLTVECAGAFLEGWTDHQPSRTVDRP